MRAPIGVYVHIPFCTAKCPYCNFNSRPPADGDIERYLAALGEEIRLRLPRGVAVDTVYFGGGTPTLLPASNLAGVLEAIRSRVAVAAGAEITVEANPETLTPEALVALRVAGFNRVSIGAQSFDDAVLAALGRRHDSARAFEALRDARAAGWDNVSLDLIYGVPGQSPEQWVATLRQALSLSPQHVSTYCLTIEPGTALDRRRIAGDIKEVGEDAELEMYDIARRTLTAAGYVHYEISNFALPGYRCRHNEKYWRGEDYTGLGAGAHSSSAAVRWANVPALEQYGDLLRRGALPVVYAERLAARRRMDEGLVLRLRTADGACLAELGARCGRDAAREYRSQIQQLTGAGLAVTDGSRVALTERGMALANEIAVRIMA